MTFPVRYQFAVQSVVRDGRLYLSHFFPSAFTTRLCTEGTRNKVLLVRLEETQCAPDENGVEDAPIFWTWYEAKDQTFHFTNESVHGVSICFPYGTKAEEKRGNGRLTRVIVTIVREATPADGRGGDTAEARAEVAALSGEGKAGGP